MYEVEVVYAIEHAQDIREKLTTNGMKLVSKTKQGAIFLIKEGSDYVVRIRITPQKAELSLKGNSFNKARLELESEISDYESVYKIFIALGYRLDTYFLRTRETYSDIQKGYKLDLDTTVDSAIVLEIEKTINDPALEETTRNAIIDYATRTLKLSKNITSEEFHKMLNDFKSKQPKEIDFDKIRQFLKH